MRIVEAGFTILSTISDGGIKELQMIERIGRICYKSEDSITKDGQSAKKFVANLIKQKHEAMLEHSSLSVLFVVDRGVSHELVRHRLFSFAQESTRYCNYQQDRFGNEITVVLPPFFKPNSLLYDEWECACLNAEQHYLRLLESGAQPQEARSVLPNSLKAELTVTGNYRQWRHFFDLRACDSTGPVHPQMSEIAKPLLVEVATQIPIVFDDLVEKINV